MKKPSQLKNSITKILKFNEKARDCDKFLQTQIWINELDSYGLKHDDFLYAYNCPGYKISSSESITRCRRILQEKNPDLRGQNWYKRHDFQDNVISDLKENF